jgi:hypothetical protein
MANGNQKRNSDNGIAPGNSEAYGVGGRQVPGGAPPQGGGYQNIYNKNPNPLEGQKKIAQNFQLNALIEMGLSQPWVSIAERVGIDNFLLMWESLDKIGLRVWIPRYSIFLRYQRNKFIESLVDSGVDTKTILQRVRKETHEQISLRQVVRLVSQIKKKY